MAGYKPKSLEELNRLYDRDIMNYQAGAATARPKTDENSALPSAEDDDAAEKTRHQPLTGSVPVGYVPRHAEGYFSPDLTAPTVIPSADGTIPVHSATENERFSVYGQGGFSPEYPRTYPSDIYMTPGIPSGAKPDTEIPPVQEPERESRQTHDNLIEDYRRIMADDEEEVERTVSVKRGQGSYVNKSRLGLLAGIAAVLIVTILTGVFTSFYSPNTAKDVNGKSYFTVSESGGIYEKNSLVISEKKEQPTTGDEIVYVDSTAKSFKFAKINSIENGVTERVLYIDNGTGARPISETGGEGLVTGVTSGLGGPIGFISGNLMLILILLALIAVGLFLISSFLVSDSGNPKKVIPKEINADKEKSGDVVFRENTQLSLAEAAYIEQKAEEERLLVEQRQREKEEAKRAELERKNAEKQAKEAAKAQKAAEKAQKAAEKAQKAAEKQAAVKAQKEQARLEQEEKKQEKERVAKIKDAAKEKALADRETQRLAEKEMLQNAPTEPVDEKIPEEKNEERTADETENTQKAEKILSDGESISFDEMEDVFSDDSIAKQTQKQNDKKAKNDQKAQKKKARQEARQKAAAEKEAARKAEE
ncbi:MAG: hypothetical protein MJ177_04760, partial [Clostridia bacterium]|nr:hypothetical protein [Clostridia bacterium]